MATHDDDRTQGVSARSSIAMALDDADLLQFEQPTQQVTAVERFVRDNPTVTVIVAVAFGFFLGRSFR